MIKVLCNQKGYPRVNWITGELHAKNLGPKSRDGSLDQRRVVWKIDLRDEKTMPFFSRQTYIVAHRSVACTQKGTPGVYRILGKLHVKNQGPESRDHQLTDRRP